jgi:hypothetical protein
MDLKYNINKIHGDLLSQFLNAEIKIEEKSSLKFGNYIEVSVINEGKEVKMIMTKKDLENYSFPWRYSENPLNEGADLVERFSSVDDLTSDVKEIFEKNRFSEEYLNGLNK